jgi:nucleoside-diphosphate-sugar epimerase
MSEKLKNVTVYENDKIRDVLVKINKNGFNGVFVINKNNKLVGVITDSDVRKNLLKNKLNVNSKAITITQKKFIKIPASKVEDSKKILLQSNKMLLPIIEKNKLIDFIHTSDLFQKKKIIKKILVIGGLGYIGSILIKDLLKLNYHVNILDINYYGCHLDKKTMLSPKLKIFYGDCDNKKILDKAMNECSDVIHLGEIVGDPAVNIDQNFSIKNNFENTVFVMSECIKKKINKFIFASSCSVYGNVAYECNEKSKLNPVSLYAKCKRECEKSILAFKSKECCPVILRLSTVYGDSPRKRFDLVANRFVIMAIKKIKISLFGASSWRPFISVNDVSRVLIKVLNAENKIVRNQIFNVGGNKENYRIMDIINTIKKYIPINYEFSKKIEDKRNYKVSFKKIKKVLKFVPKDNLKKIILYLIKKYKKTDINEKNINYYNDKKIYKILGKKI